MVGGVRCVEGTAQTGARKIATGEPAFVQHVHLVEDPRDEGVAPEIPLTGEKRLGLKLVAEFVVQCGREIAEHEALFFRNHGRGNSNARKKSRKPDQKRETPRSPETLTLLSRSRVSIGRTFAQPGNKPCNPR